MAGRVRKLVRGVAGRFITRSHRFPWLRLDGIRRTLTVRMDTTNRCNLRCRMCNLQLSDSDPDRVWHEMAQDLFDRIRRQVFPGARVVGLSCGAEPFMNPGFAGHLASLWESDVPVREVVTNGTLFDWEIIESLLATPPTSLFVSVDGRDPSTHAAIRGGADLQDTIRWLSRLIDLRNERGRRFPILRFSTTLQRANLGELAGIVELAAATGARSVDVVPMVAFEGLDTLEDVVDLGDDATLAGFARARERADRLGVVLTLPSLPPAGTDGSGLAESGAGWCRYVRSRWVFIDPDGHVYPCPHWNTARPLGDLNVSSFREVWRGTGYNDLRRRLRAGVRTGSCAVCPETCGHGSSRVLKEPTGSQATGG